MIDLSEEKLGVVYLIRNRINGKVYVGRTIQSLDQRFSQHINDCTQGPHTRCLLNAIRKYGKENFTIEALTKVIPYDDVITLEVEFISQYQSFPPELKFGYNMTPGGRGGGLPSNPCSIDTRRKIGDANRGKKRTIQQRQNLSKAMKGVKITWGNKISQTLKAKGIKPREKGFVCSAEIRKNISNACMKRSSDPTYLKKIGLASSLSWNYKKVLLGSFYGS